MIANYTMIKESLPNYKAKDIKIKRMSDNQEIIKLTKNLYETDKNISGYLVANAIYGPSYLSFDYALSYYGLIPEAVYVYTSATFNKRKRKNIRMHWGLILIVMFLRIFILMASKYFMKTIIPMRWQHLKRPCAINYTH